MPPSSRSTTKRLLTHGQVDQWLERPGQEQADPAEGDGAEHHDRQGRHRRPPSRPPGLQPRAQPTSDQHDRLHELHPDDADDLGPQQPGPAEGGGAQALQDPVAPLEAGADAQGDHRRWT